MGPLTLAPLLSWGSLLQRGHIPRTILVPAASTLPPAERIIAGPAMVATSSKVRSLSAGGTVATGAKMPQTWVPLASAFELDPERPTPVRFLNKRYVIWRDNEGSWRVMDDACAHRLAPLSEGRIDRESGNLEISIQCSRQDIANRV